MDLSPTTNYAGDVYNFLKQAEGEPTDKATGQVYAYADPKGIPTIGIGINLQVSSNLNLVLQMLGFDVTGQRLANDPVAAAAEAKYISAITNKVNSVFSQDSSASNSVRTVLDGILQQRAADSAYANSPQFNRVTDFSFANSTVSANALTTVLNGYPDPVTGAFIKGYEARLDDWLNASGVANAIPGLLNKSSKKGTGSGLTFDTHPATLYDRRISRHLRREPWPDRSGLNLLVRFITLCITEVRSCIATSPPSPIAASARTWRTFYSARNR